MFRERLLLLMGVWSHDSHSLISPSLCLLPVLFLKRMRSSFSLDPLLICFEIINLLDSYCLKIKFSSKYTHRNINVWAFSQFPILVLHHQVIELLLLMDMERVLNGGLNGIGIWNWREYFYITGGLNGRIWRE